DIAEHKDINDKDQTVTSDEGDESGEPKISTNADFANGATEVVAGAQVDDTVTYEGLVPGKEYTLKAELISKADGKTVLGEGEKTFTPDAANGEVVVEIIVDESVTKPVEAAVAFEELTSVEVNKDGKETPDADSENPNDIAEHKDINDKDQTVTSEGGSEENAIVSTNADFEGGLREVVAGAKIVDQVSYEGLVPGKEYFLDAQLISKADGKTVLGETIGHKFVPTAPKGVEAVTITVNDDVTEPVKAAVAFETLTSKEVNSKGEETPGNETPNEIGEHKDINDKDQTVTSENPSDTPDEDEENGGGKGSSKKDLPWWLLLIPGLGLIKIIVDGVNGGNGGHDGGNGGHDGGNHNDVTEDGGRGNNHGESTEENGGNTGRDDREVTVLDATPPEDAGQPLPSNSKRVEIKHVPSGATELDPGMKDFIQ
ncbi:VaFE repeat-containing surface-anchored protein, partial [uncultured Corynebacterium sp.]|uniref:VaFE repeat-containing surface-anchored protein n=3 Tax=Corynebacterium TaxID=1716 RepID=UPI00288B4530